MGPIFIDPATDAGGWIFAMPPWFVAAPDGLLLRTGRIGERPCVWWDSRDKCDRVTRIRLFVCVLLRVSTDKQRLVGATRRACVRSRRSPWRKSQIRCGGPGFRRDRAPVARKPSLRVGLHLSDPSDQLEK